MQGTVGFSLGPGDPIHGPPGAGTPQLLGLCAAQSVLLPSLVRQETLPANIACLLQGGNLHCRQQGPQSHPAKDNLTGKKYVWPPKGFPAYCGCIVIHKTLDSMEGSWRGLDGKGEGINRKRCG